MRLGIVAVQMPAGLPVRAIVAHQRNGSERAIAGYVAQPNGEILNEPSVLVYERAEESTVRLYGTQIKVASPLTVFLSIPRCRPLSEDDLGPTDKVLDVLIGNHCQAAGVARTRRSRRSGHRLWIASSPERRLCERRAVWPPMAAAAPCMTSFIAAVRSTKQAQTARHATWQMPCQRCRWGECHWTARASHAAAPPCGCRTSPRPPSCPRPLWRCTEQSSGCLSGCGAWSCLYTGLQGRLSAPPTPHYPPGSCPS